MGFNLDTLGIIAGNRELPFRVIEGARRLGVKRVVVAAFINETSESIAQHTDAICWVRVGQLSKIIDFFKSHHVSHCVMAGQVAPKNLWDLRPDARALKILLKVKERNAHTLFAAIGDELAESGITLTSGIPWLESLMPKSGFRLGPAPDHRTMDDIRFGWRIAKEISRLEIGQTVVVKNGTTLAVEGLEGTDACLERGGKLAGKQGQAVAIKLAKSGHDLRFDIPCLGKTTIETCIANGIHTLAIEPDRSILLEESEVKNICKSNGFTLLCVSDHLHQES